MKLTTPIELPKSSESIALGTPVLALGSCFADRVGHRFARYLFPSTVNPTGIQYNPTTLAQSLKQKRAVPSLFLHDGLWRSLEHHSVLAAPTPQQTHSNFLKAEEKRLAALSTCKLLLLTLGTAQTFQLQSSGKIVANCHRLPQYLFRRNRLTVQQTLNQLLDPLQYWLEQDSARRVVLTVSPVRYLRQGLVESNRSKAVLLLTCEELARLQPRIEYFPAYEIITDELRDYRFFQQDMTHPTEQAVQYVWERFSETYFSPTDLATIKAIEKLSQLAEHRASSPASTQKLRIQGLQRLRKLQSLHPNLKYEDLESKFRPLTGVENSGRLERPSDRG